jgi:TatD DNase family protein
MIDSHCHLDSCDDPLEAADPTLRAMLSVGTTVESNSRTLLIAERIANVWAAVGIHPNNASDARSEDVRAQVERQAEHRRVVAVGETGFDTHWDRESLTSQHAAFEWQAQLAASVDLPLILHVRDRQGGHDASREAASAMRAVGYRKGVLHCFNGHPGLLATGLDLGWMVSFAGNLTYPSAHGLRAAALEVPEERLLVETDSPYLAPVPRRGRPNTPANVRYTAAFLGELRGLTSERIEETTDANAARFFSFAG